MTTNRQKNIHALPHNSGGFTLIELLVGMFISVFMMLAITTIMTNTRKSFDVTDGLTRMQENARFAMQYIGKDIRMAGYYGCRTEQIALEGNIDQFDATSVTDAGTDDPTSGVGDSITIRYYSPPQDTWSASSSDGSGGTDADAEFVSGTSVQVPEDLAALLKQQKSLHDEGLGPAPILHLTDCSNTSTDGYEVTDIQGETVTVSPAIDGANGLIEVGVGTVGNTEVTYRIGYPDDGRNMPILFRNDSELAEGVEFIRFLYGVDGGDADKLPDRFVPWETVQADPTLNVVSIQVGVLAQSVNTTQGNTNAGQNAALKQADNDFTILDVSTGSGLTLDEDANVSRRVFTQTFQVRNYELHN